MLLFSFFCHLIQCERLEITQTCMFNPMPVEASTGSKQGIFNHHEECTVSNQYYFIFGTLKAFLKKKTFV